jgi:hypothetical protein
MGRRWVLLLAIPPGKRITKETRRGGKWGLEEDLLSY